MKIERLKSILLVLLVISSIVLTINKWFNEKLWPEGYNFFSDVKKQFFTSSNDNPDNLFDPVEEVLKPAKIILNNLGNHVLFTKSSPEYDTLFHQIKSALELTFSSEQSLIADDNEWNDNLKRKSCYFSYPIEYDSGYFFSQLSYKYSGSLSSVREFILAKDTRISSVSYLYIKDSASGIIYKHRLSFESEVIDSLINRAPNTSAGTNYYSFELNFDRADEDAVEQHIVIDPDVLIDITEKQISAIEEQNLFNNIAHHPEIYTPILQNFGYNTSTIRKYTEQDDSMVFVENYGTLKLHTNGVIDYKSVNSTQGVELGGDTIYECINSCISFANDVSASLNFSDNMYYEISSDIKDITSKSFTLTFDYYINDSKIVVPEDIYSLNHAITVEVVSGKIISYKQLCKNFYTSSSFINCSSAIYAIDMLESDSKQDTGTISDIFTAYTFDSVQNSWLPLWYIENSNGEITIIATQPEV